MSNPLIITRIQTKSEEEMDTKVKMYFDTYPKQGYMTYVKNTYYDPQVCMHVTEVARLSSCD